MEAHHTRYEMKEWVDANGKIIEARLPSLTQHPHFGPERIAYLLHPHHHCRVT